MRRTAALVAVLAALTVPAAAAVGGGHGVIGSDGFLEPPGITDQSRPNFAQPVRSNGVVAFPLITDAPAAKYPAGTNVLTLDVSQADHPSAAHCAAMR